MGDGAAPRGRTTASACPSDDVIVATDFGSARLPSPQIADAGRRSRWRATCRPTTGGSCSASGCVRLAWQRSPSCGPAPTAASSPRSSPSLRAGRELHGRWSTGTWPSLRAPALVRSGARQPAHARRAADGAPRPRRAARPAPAQDAPRVADERWTRADLVLLDEAEALINGVPVTYGHVVVDEAQDLTRDGAAAAGPPHPRALDDRARRPRPGHRGRRPERLGRGDGPPRAVRRGGAQAGADRGAGSGLPRAGRNPRLRQPAAARRRAPCPPLAFGAHGRRPPARARHRGRGAGAMRSPPRWGRWPNAGPRSA